MRRPAFWIALVLASAAAVFVGIRYFPQAFSIVALDITMDRGHALDAARAVAARDGLGPAGFREAASFSGDDEAQTFIELDGGGKEAFTRMLRDGLYAAYAWHVRHFKDGETNETTIAFTPDGRPYGFIEKLREDAPGAALDAAAARAIAESGAAQRWSVDLAKYTLAEQGQERRPGGRVDHTFTYERSGVAFGEGRIRLRLSVSGDRLTGVEHFVKIPEAFTRRYASMRSANDLIGIGSTVGLALLYVIGGIGVGCLDEVGVARIGDIGDLGYARGLQRGVDLCLPGCRWHVGYLWIARAARPRARTARGSAGCSAKAIRQSAIIWRC